MHIDLCGKGYLSFFPQIAVVRKKCESLGVKFNRRELDQQGVLDHFHHRGMENLITDLSAENAELRREF